MIMLFPRGTIYNNQKGTSKYITSIKIAQKILLSPLAATLKGSSKL
jgi:hypothetical protein